MSRAARAPPTLHRLQHISTHNNRPQQQATATGHNNRHASATSLARHPVVVSTYGLLAAKEAEIAPRSDRHRPEIAPGGDGGGGGGDDATWRTKRGPSTCPTERRSCLHLLQWTRVILLDAEARACCYFTCGTQRSVCARGYMDGSGGNAGFSCCADRAAGCSRR